MHCPTGTHFFTGFPTDLLTGNFCPTSNSCPASTSCPTRTLRIALFAALAFAATALPVAQPASAQTFNTDVQWDLSLWPNQRQHYWHTTKVDIESEVRWRWITASVYGRVQAWGAAPHSADNSQANPLIAEFINAIERHHGALLMGRVGEWSAGLQIRRRAVHHVWRHKKVFGRHDYFPVGGGWKEGRKQCTDGDRDPVAGWTNGDCPSIGYAERIGVRIAKVEGNLTGYVSVFPFSTRTSLFRRVSPLGARRSSSRPSGRRRRRGAWK